MRTWGRISGLAVAFLAGACTQLGPNSPAWQPGAPTASRLGGDVPEWSRRLCIDEDNYVACHSNGQAHLTGTLDGTTDTPVAIDPIRALYYFDLGCQKGNAKSCFEVGRMAMTGSGGPIDKKRAYEAFQKSCGSFDKVGCDEMRRLSGEIGRLRYDANGPRLAWYCNKYWCYADPVQAPKTENDTYVESTVAWCASIAKGDKLYNFCATTREVCFGFLTQSKADGASEVSPCVERGPTVPGQPPGSGWYCLDEWGSSACTRELAWCQASEHSYSGRKCQQQTRAACRLAFDTLNNRYVSRCYPTVEACTNDSTTWGKADYSEASGCFGAP